MEIRRCQKDNMPGFRAGLEGKCYTYTPGDRESRLRAKRKAKLQARNLERNKRGPNHRP